MVGVLIFKRGWLEGRKGVAPVGLVVYDVVLQDCRPAQAASDGVEPALSVKMIRQTFQGSNEVAAAGSVPAAHLEKTKARTPVQGQANPNTQ